tara:strand:+ start:42534 stop:42836 length:303 start_codon:yes stop_codon:yes gene_type:complete
MMTAETISNPDAWLKAASFEVKEEVQQWLYRAPYGKERRDRILAYCKEGMAIPVNFRGCIVLDKDPDLKRLLKKGDLKRTKHRTPTMINSNMSITYVVKA